MDSFISRLTKRQTLIVDIKFILLKNYTPSNL